ncbi:MAG: hypothetical protein F4128_00345, partial [Gammaproteobacteria bacterium]|nr:hypothetical protein [Gammaproteobacteria bacterium]
TVEAVTDTDPDVEEVVPVNDPAPPASCGAIDTADGWAAFADGSDLAGLTRELVMNMVPVRLEGDTLELVLADAPENLLRDDRVEKIRQRCSAYLGRSLQLDVKTGSPEAISGESPARRREWEHRERLARAEQTFCDDPNVRDLMERFDAEVVPDSVRPPLE